MSDTSRHPDSFRLASYNVRKCIGTDRRRDPKRTLRVIAGLHADIVALQEADKRLGKRPAAIPHDLVGEHTDFEYVELSTSSVSIGWHGNAVLLRKGTKIRDFERIDLPGFEPRGAVLVEIEHNGRVLRIVSAHLGLLRHSRRRQWEAISQFLKKMPAAPTLIAGDFNEWSKSRGMEPIETEFEMNAPGLSFHARRPVAPLDRIAFNKELEIGHCGVDMSADARVASDHLPVWAEFRFK